MENTFWTALGTSLLAAFVTSLGIYTIRRFAVDWEREQPGSIKRHTATSETG